MIIDNLFFLDSLLLVGKSNLHFKGIIITEQLNIISAIQYDWL